jgi:hypothetical protein
MTGTDWKRERLEQLRTRIRIEEAILRSLRAELEEIQWINREAAEMRYRWDEVLRAEDQDLRQAQDDFALVWLAGEHNLKARSPAA